MFQLNFHGWNEESLHEKVPKDILPEEVGGTDGPVDTKVHTVFCNTFKSCCFKIPDTSAYYLYLHNTK